MMRSFPAGTFLAFLMLLATACGAVYSDNKPAAAAPPATADSSGRSAAPGMDTALYDLKWREMANGDTAFISRVKQVYPLPGALLPFNRIIAFYGNFYSKQMGILGEVPEDQLLEKLAAEVRSWRQADSSVTVVPALHYIAVTAQGSPGRDGKYRLRMPFAQIDKALALAAKIDALVFIDLQVGFSSLQAEIPLLQKYLALPNVHLGIDPEFSMKGTATPGREIGTFDAADINYAADYLAALVREHGLPPKILVVHRFTRNMVTNARHITLRPEVQVVMHMDGWGAPALKQATYRSYIAREPVQFTGFKLFWKNDTRQAPRIMRPEEVLQLKPRPVYIQYQ